MNKLAVIVALAAVSACVDGAPVDKGSETETVTQAVGPKSAPQDVHVVNSTLAPVPVALTGGPGLTPLLVVSRDEPARQPFQRAGLCGANNCSIFQVGVPAGKRLVIEQISGEAYVAGGTVVDVSVETSVDGFVVAHHVARLESPVTDNVRFVQSIRVYADPSTYATIKLSPHQGQSIPGARYALSGYLVDLDPFVPTP